jgi:hypothetical protein
MSLCLRDTLIAGTLGALAFCHCASPVRAADCEGILASPSPVLLHGSSLVIFGGTVKANLVSFRVTRGDPASILQLIGPGNDPVIELSFKGILATRIVNLKSKQVTDYEYPSVQGTLTEGSELRYTRLVKRDGVVASTETGLVHIGQKSEKLVGGCKVEVLEIDSDVRSDKDPERATRSLYAPRLGYFVKADSAGLVARGHIATAYSATSLELAP